MHYPPIPQRKNCNCEDPCISTDDVYYAGPNLPNSGINTSDILTEVIEKLDAIYAVPTLQRVTEMDNFTTLPIIADSFVKIGGDGTNLLLDDGTVLPIGDLPSPTAPGLQQVLDTNNTVTNGNAIVFIDPSDTNNLSGISYGGYVVQGKELNDSLSLTSMLNTGIRFYNGDIGSNQLYFNANLTIDNKSNWEYTNNYFIPKKPQGDYTLATLDDIPTRPYKVYTALLSQTGTNDPTATILENTLGEAIVWTRSSVGAYVGTLTQSLFTDDKTAIILTASPTGIIINGRTESTSAISVGTMNIVGTYVDNSLVKTTVEIRVYN